MANSVATSYCGASQSGSQNEGVHNKLWHSCAGPLVSVPRIGERAYYFPKGHVEQVEAFTPHEKKLPYMYSLDKILCKVVHVLLQADPETEEVYARITLLPNHDQNEVTIPDPALPEPPSCIVHSMCKTLTELDITTQQGFFLPYRHAVDGLPPMDTSGKPPLQELVAWDIHGNEWHFCHTLQGQPERHCLTAGWSEFVGAKKLLPGDAVIFLRGKNGGLHVGVRKQMHVSGYMPSSETSGQSPLDVLAVASHAIAAGTLFSVIYKPRKSHSPFVISLNKYLEAHSNRLSAGLKFKMRSEGEQALEKRVGGTILSVGSTEASKYEASEWRSIKVRWNEPVSTSHPDSVSPWEIEPYKSSSWTSFFIGKLKKLFCCDCI